MTKQGNKSYAYGWMNKVMSISENGKVKSTYDYHVDGQVARRVGSDGNGQSFFWDGLALIKRGNMSLTNEPYVTGGNPVIAGDKTLFNDILGTTQGSTDGWNNFAYCNNWATDCIDWLGASNISIVKDLWKGYFFGKFTAVFNDNYASPAISHEAFNAFGNTSCTIGSVISFGGNSFGIGATFTLSGLSQSRLSSTISSGTLGGKATKFIVNKYYLTWTITGTAVSGGSTVTRSETFHDTITVRGMVQE